MARVGVVPILGAVALLLLLALRRHQPPARVIRKHQRHSRRAARNFFVGAPIDVAADADASSLRRVARLASHDRGRGPELSLICSDADGAAMALNSLLNHIALGYRHAVVVGYEAALCSALGEAARQLPPLKGQTMMPPRGLRRRRLQLHRAASQLEVLVRRQRSGRCPPRRARHRRQSRARASAAHAPMPVAAGVMIAMVVASVPVATAAASPAAAAVPAQLRPR